MVTAITAALAFTIALFWRDAIKEFIDKVLVKLPFGNSWIFSLLAAVIVTIICVVGIWLLARWKK